MFKRGFTGINIHLVVFLFQVVIFVRQAQAQTYVYPSPSDDRPVSVPSQLQGQSFQTDLFTGTASTSIPIVVAPGTGGMQPSLALTYNSGSRAETFLSVGWDLAGLGYIERNTKFGVPTYTSSDTYILVLNGSNDLFYVASDGYYHTKQESFLRIQYVAADPNTTPATLEHWLVTDKKGTQYRFGNNPDSTLAAMGRNATLRWSLDQVTDTHGNQMSFSYNNDTANGMIYPTTITYTQGNGLTTFRTVEFNYEARPDAWTSHRYGAPMTIANRLAYIDVKMNGAMVRRYELTYSNSANSNNSLLTQVQEYGSDATPTRGTGTSFPPMTVQYSASANVFTNASTLNKTWAITPPKVADFTGDGKPDILYCALDSSSGLYKYYVAVSTGTTFTTNDVTWGGPSCSAKVISLADFNGDGKADLATGDTTGVTVYLSTGSAFTTGWTWAKSIGDSTASYDNIQIMFADIDGDGKTDLAYPLSYLNCNAVNDPRACTRFWVHLSTGSGFGTAFELTRYFISTNWVKLMDLNGDGRADLLRDDGNLEVALSMGNSFVNSTTWLSPTPTVATGTCTPYGINLWRFGDFNGDGLLDFATIDCSQNGAANPMNVTVYLNKGNGFTAGTLWMDEPSTYWAPNEVYVGDFNGDGKADLIGHKSYPYPDTWEAHLSSGTPFVVGTPGSGFNASGTGTWYPYDPFGIYKSLFYDFNADGKTEFMEQYASNSPSNAFNFVLQVADTQPVNLAQTIKNSFGGSATNTYAPSSKYSNNYLPFVQQTVRSITTNDGVGNSFTTQYFYQGGTYDIPSREFRGFSQVTVTDPTGAYSKTTFLQTDQLKGKPSSVETYDSSNALYAKTVNTWNYTTPFAGVTFPFLSQEDAYSYDGGATAKQSQTKYLYDGYGNVKEIDRLGDIGITTDDRYDYIEFAVNASAYIVSLPSHLYANTGGGVKVSETWNYYDGATGNTTPPTKGDLTQICRWLSGGTNPCATFGYDAYGNRTSATDANGHTSSVFFDAAYHTFPVTETNALNQSVTKTYWGVNTALTPIAGSYTVPGMLATATDPNAVRFDSYWDALDRPFESVVPPDTAAAPTTKYTYYNYQSATAPAGTLVQKRIDVGQGMIDAYTFIDGLGRTVQTKTPNSDGVNQNVIDTTYNSVGLTATTSVPYSSAKTSAYTTPVTTVKKTATLYDPIRRSSRITNTDATYSSRAYDKWTISLIDPSGRKKVETRDAFGRLIQVDEYAGADGRDSTNYPATAFSLYATTTYDYNSFDTAGNNTQKITDASGNVTTLTYDTLARKSAMHDPDMGDWSYQYDPVGNLLRQSDPNWQVIDFAYDALNRMKTKTVSGPFPDLIPTAVTASASGNNLVINDSVKNQAPTGGAGAFNVGFYLSSTPTYQPAAAIAICNRSVGSLAAGASDPSTGTTQTVCPVPAAATAGSYYIVVVEDDGNAIAEHGEDNNTQVTTTTVTIGPELVVAQIAPNASSVNTGATLSVNDTIQNLANISAGAFAVDYRLSTNRVYGDADDILLSTTRSIASLPALSSSAATTPLAIPSTIPAGLYYLCAKADSANAITETDETNNTLCSTSQVTVVDVTLPTVGNLLATASSPTQVNLTWTASDNTGIDHYQVERSTNNSSYTLLSSPTTASFTDTTVTGATTYFYRVRAYDAAGNAATSNIDLATTVIFTDDPIVAKSTVIKAVHITELRQVVNAVRASAGLAAVTTWTDPSLTAGMVIKAAHLQELRDNLNPALTALGLTPPAYTDLTITPGVTQVKKAHVDEIRNAVK